MTDRDHDAASKLLIDEIEEDLKREQYAKLWKAYGNWIIAAAIAVIAGVAGYQGWHAWHSDRRESDAITYANVTQLSAPEAVAGLEKLSAEAKTGYHELAELRRASLLAESGDVAEATAAYDAMAADQSIDELYRGLATLRGVMLQMESGDPATLDGKLQTLVGGPWRHTAQEMQAVLAQKGGDTARARSLYQRLADDLTTPAGLRARAAEMLAALGPAPADKG